MASKRFISAITALVTVCSTVMPFIPTVSAADDISVSKGDINGDSTVNADDLRLLSNYLLGKGSLSAEEGKKADLTNDNILDVFDMMLLREQFKGAGYTGLLINEVCSSAKDSVTDASGASPDWIEIYNNSDNDIDISGVGVSDGSKNKFKFVFPQGTTIKADNYILIYCDDAVTEAEGEHHAAFKISALGETVYLTAPDGSEIDMVQVPELASDVTYGRYKNGTSTFRFLTYTPGKSNNEATDLNVVEKPLFSVNGGFYDSEFQLTLTDDNGNEIYYTTDGSDPRTSDTAKLYTDSIRIYNNTNDPNIYSAIQDITLAEYIPTSEKVEKGIVIRAASKSIGGKFSDVEHNSYFIGKNSSYFKDMKVISMATDSDYLFDNDNGAYMIGSEYYEWLRSPEFTEYDPADTRNPTNYNKEGRESEFPVSIQVIENGEAVYNADLGAKIAGNWTRAAAQKSFRLVTRSEYGDSSIKYPLFDELTDINGKVIDRFDKVTLWNGGNDYQYLHFRDALIQEIAEDRNVETMGSEPCVLFIDGEFWGFYMLRERVDADYLEAHFGLDKDDVAVLKNGKLDDGLDSDLEEFKQFCIWAISANMANQLNYDKFCETVDVQSFIDYMAIETYINNSDWQSTGVNNWQTWRSKTVHSDIPEANGKWRFVLYDTDISCGLYNSEKNVANYDSLANNGPKSQYYNFSAILKNLIRNDEFRQQFYDSYIDIIDTTFGKTTLNDKITEYVNAYENATRDTLKRFSLGWAEKNYSKEVQLIREFFRSRPDYAKRYLEQYCDESKLDIDNNLSITNFWTYYGEGEFSSDQADNSFTVKVNTAEEKSWSIQSQAKNILLESGKTYTLTFKASCTVPCELPLGFNHNLEGSYPVCWSDKAELTQQLQEFSYTFTIDDETYYDWQLYFNYASTAGTYKIVNPRLVEVK